MCHVAIHNDLACFCGQAFDLEKENYMWIMENYDCDRKGIRNAIRLKDSGPSM